MDGPTLHCRHASPISWSETDQRAGDGPRSGEAPSTARSITARLLVAADGGRSAIREAASVSPTPPRLWPPRRHCQPDAVAAAPRVSPTKRFTETGPLALLPMTGNRCGPGWTARDADLADVLALDDRAFLAALQERFGFRLGRFVAVGRRSHYPLELRLAETQVLDRVAIIGNAAHTVHPIAGQGFNLGIRDVAMLADVLIEARPQRTRPRLAHRAEGLRDGAAEGPAHRRPRDRRARASVRQPARSAPPRAQCRDDLVRPPAARQAPAGARRHGARRRAATAGRGLPPDR